MPEGKVINYVPGSMSFATGFLGGFGCATDPFMLADEEKAREIVRGLLGEGRMVERAELGLDGDWNENHSTIYGPLESWEEDWLAEGHTDSEGFHPYDAYGGSNWATPMLAVFFSDGPSEWYPCWKIEEKTE